MCHTQAPRNRPTHSQTRRVSLVSNRVFPAKSCDSNRGIGGVRRSTLKSTLSDSVTVRNRQWPTVDKTSLTTTYAHIRTGTDVARQDPGCRGFESRQPPQSSRPGLRIRGPGLRRWCLDGPWFGRPGFRRWVFRFGNVANICHIPKTALPYSYSGSPVPPERCSQSRFQYPRPS